ncbi:hypothetical protein SSS_10589 [Sarcoptes scabiei]|nr:hypothetical protein SSS_10589 [Sarcoptes scabiei]
MDPRKLSKSMISMRLFPLSLSLSLLIEKPRHYKIFHHNQSFYISNLSNVTVRLNLLFLSLSLSLSSLSLSLSLHFRKHFFFLVYNRKRIYKQIVGNKIAIASEIKLNPKKKNQRKNLF